ncbi:MAG: glycogen synthase GlgA [Lachnospiraceae bacterium]|nr:glycogen synthase GlgA [Lachnospiraceae bacterium]
MKNIALIASESVPFIKTGGLADVVGALPKYFDKEAYETIVILPKYQCMQLRWKERLEYVTHFYMDLGWRSQYVGVLTAEYDGVRFYFIDNEYYFAGGRPYGYIHEDVEKFAFFSKAALSALQVIGFHPDIIHCHDWQTGLIPVYLNDSFQQNPFYRGIKTVMTIHNLKFQGIWNLEKIQDTTGLANYFFTADKLESYGDANYLKGGLVFADRITTVSKTYANEIKTAFYGEGLDGLLRAKENSLSGIVNGIDYEVYNPAADPMIVKNFSVANFRKEKIKNKRALQEELGLAQDDKAVMIGIVSRLTDQKGFDLIACVLEEICSLPIQLVVLGTGEEQYENMFRHFAWKYPDKVSANIYYSDELAHRIYASCDTFLMPSLFEPCGLSQLMSLRYGTLPIVRETGGLFDTVQPYNEYTGEGTGFSFANYNAHEMLDRIEFAVWLFRNKKRAWNKVVEQAMKQDFSWAASAKEYEALYESLVER